MHILPKNGCAYRRDYRSAYKRDFYKTKCMSFLIENEKLSKEYDENLEKSQQHYQERI